MWCCAVDFSAKPTYEEASVMELIALLWDQANDLLMCWAWHPKTSVFMSSVTCVAFDTFDDIPQCTVCSLIYSICYFAVFRIYELVHPVCTFVQECEPLVCVCVCVCVCVSASFQEYSHLYNNVNFCAWLCTPVPMCICASILLYLCTSVPCLRASVPLCRQSVTTKWCVAATFRSSKMPQGRNVSPWFVDDSNVCTVQCGMIADTNFY